MSRVLVVDDRLENLKAMEALLAPLGHEVVSVSSGIEALRRLLDDDSFSVILLDVQMPDIDGFETAQRIRERERTRDIPIVFLTAMANDQVLRGYEMGAVDYIAKPVDPDILRAKVGAFVELEEKRRQLREKSAELERINRELDEFARVVSHDLQEPLRSIAGYLDLLVDHLPAGDDDAHIFVQRAQAAVERQFGLIRHLLSLARAGGTPEEAEEVDLADVVASAIENCSAAVRDAEALVEVGELPTVVGRSADLRQVFQNLVGNSLKFRGEARPRVRISAHQEGDVWIIDVQDNGIGIPAEASESIFQMFRRAAPSGYEGTGVGLAMCRKLVERSGGRITAVNTDEGACIRLVLPTDRRKRPRTAGVMA